MKGDVLAKSLRVHKPLASAFKILHKPSLGGASRTTKFPRKEQPALARLSAHLFASLNIWVTLTCWNCSRRYLQSFSKAAHELLMALLDSTRLTTTWASNSTCKWLIPNWAASISPSRKTQNSAATLVIFPIFLIKPFTHFPLWSRISPPPPAHLGFPCDAPSEFNLYHPGSGLIQQIGLTVQCLIFCLLLTQNYSSKCIYLLLDILIIIILFYCFL